MCYFAYRVRRLLLKATSWNARGLAAIYSRGGRAFHSDRSFPRVFFFPIERFSLSLSFSLINFRTVVDRIPRASREKEEFSKLKLNNKRENLREKKLTEKGDVSEGKLVRGSIRVSK